LAHWFLLPEETFTPIMLFLSPYVLELEACMEKMHGKTRNAVYLHGSIIRL